MLRRASPSAVLLIGVVLSSFLTALVMDIAQYNLIHGQVSMVKRWLGELGRLLHVPAGFVTTNLYRNSVAFATESLLNHLQHSFHSHIKRRKRPLGDITNNEQQWKGKKRERKSGEDQTEHKNLAKMTLIGFFTDSRCRPMRTYLKDHDMLFLERSVRRAIDNDERLKFILVADRRKDDTLAAEAHTIILRHYRGGENASVAEPLAEINPPPAARAAAPIIFDFHRLKEIAENLNFLGATANEAR